MPKMRTRKSASKRIGVTGTGRYTIRHAFKSHLLTRKSEKRKRRLRQKGLAAKTETGRLRRLLPYLH